MKFNSGSERFPSAWLGVALLAAGLVRIYFASEPLWIDELHSGWVVQPESNIASRAADGNQTPLYFLLLDACCRLFGMSIFTLRLPSLFFGTGCIVLCARVVWGLTQQKAATGLAIVIASLDCLHVFWSSEARPYAMLQFFALLQFASLYGTLLDNKQRDRLKTNFALSLTTGLLPLIHLSALLLIGCQCVYLLLRIQDRYAFRAMLSLLCGLLGLFFATDTLTNTIHSKDNWRLFVNTASFLYQLAPQGIIMAIAFVGFSIGSLGRRRKIPDDQVAQNRGVVWILFFSTLAPILLALLLTITNLLPIAAVRYVAASLCLITVLVSVMVGKSQVWQPHLAAVLIVTTIATNPILHSVLSGSTPQFRFENWESVAQQIQRRTVRNTPVFLFSNLIEDRNVRPDSSEAYTNYLQFPLNGPYKIKNSTISPMPTMVNRRWTRHHLEQLVSAKNAVIVARVQLPDFEAILSELENLATSAEISLQVERQFQDRNHIKLAFVTTISE